jgi:hypothetical protein
MLCILYTLYSYSESIFTIYQALESQSLLCIVLLLYIHVAVMYFIKSLNWTQFIHVNVSFSSIFFALFQIFCDSWITNNLGLKAKSKVLCNIRKKYFYSHLYKYIIKAHVSCLFVLCAIDLIGNPFFSRLLCKFMN